MKLLIVDDEIRAVQALVKRVNWQEYDFEPPLAAYSMAQAQGVFQQQEIYLMLCDIEMPQGSGLELFEWVKTYYPLTECIFVTCHDEYSYLRSAMQLGSCDYLLKPINYTLLQEALKNVVERIQRRKDKPAGSAEQPKDSLLPANTLNVSNPYIRQLLHVLSERLTENFAHSGTGRQYALESAVHHAPVQKRNGLFYSAVHHIPKDCTCGAVFGRYEPADYRGGASLRV